MPYIMDMPSRCSKLPKSTPCSLGYIYQNRQFEIFYSKGIDIYPFKGYKYAHKLNFFTRRMNNNE